MPDVFTKAKRSAVMSRIRSRGNKDTELRLMAVFRAQGITGWRRQASIRFQVWLRPSRKIGSGSKLQDSSGRKRVKNLKPVTWNMKPQAKSVRPDFVFRRERLAVFVNGCFWHGCAEHYRRPKGNRRFWDAKIARNIERDAAVTKALRKTGWRVLHLWEHELTKKREPRLLARLRRWIGFGD